MAPELQKMETSVSFADLLSPLRRFPLRGKEPDLRWSFQRSAGRGRLPRRSLRASRQHLASRDRAGMWARRFLPCWIGRPWIGSFMLSLSTPEPTLARGGHSCCLRTSCTAGSRGASPQPRLRKLSAGGRSADGEAGV